MSIEIKDLTKTYTQGDVKIHATKNLNVSIQTPETVAIVGPSGSGKTTLLSLIAGLDHPTSGEIKIDNSHLESFTELEFSNYRSKNIGIVFQQFYLMPHLTALENVMLPLEILNTKDAKKIAIEALTNVDLEHRLNHLPSELSGGEKQRVAIARAFVHKPKIILADEPSGNLDFKTGQQVMDLLFDIVKKNNITLILVTHDLELAQRCQKIIQMQNGQIL